MNIKKLFINFCLFTFCIFFYAEGTADSVLQQGQNLKLSPSVVYNDDGQKIAEDHHILVNGQETRLFQIRWSYDSLKRLVSIQEGVGTALQKTTSYQYTPNSQLEAVIKPDGTALSFQYNEDGTLAQFLASDGSFAYEYHYDERLRIIKVVDLIHHLIQSRSYNDYDEIIEENLGHEGLTLKNRYDSDGKRTHLILPDDSQIIYHYKGTQPASVERVGLQNYEHHYHFNDSSEKLASSYLAGDLGLLSYDYDPEGKLQGIKSPWWSEEMSHGRHDSHGNLCSVVIQDPKDRIDYTYTYSEDQQLIQEEGHLNKKYQYDTFYNRLSEDGQEWKTNELNQLIQTPQAHFSYDLNGNLIEKNNGSFTTIFEYDALNRLVKAKTHSHTIHYTYDAFNRQIRQQTYSKVGKLEKTEYLIYDGDNEIGKTDEQGQIKELRILGLGKGAEIGSAIALELNQRVFIPIHDHQGSVRCLLDMQNQSVSEFYRYSAFGLEEIYDSNQQLVDGSIVGNDWRFSSKRKDSLTGLLSYGKRHYDPTMGRWATPDPLFFYDCPNLYTFARNNPINRFDLYGLFSIRDTWNSAVQFLYSSLESLYNQVTASYEQLENANSSEKIARLLFGDGFYDFGGYKYIESECGSFGENELSDKVRITFVNGSLINKSTNDGHLDRLSKAHGNTKIHYIFRPTKGWTDDLLYSVKLNMGYRFGFRSHYSEQIVQTWRQMIDEMGGVEGGGTIIHYAHSLGGTETERAKHLLTPEEQKMIRVITFGSSEFISREGFQDAINHVSMRDFVTLQWISRRNIHDLQYNVIYYNGKSSPIMEHYLGGPTYGPLIAECGKQFLQEFIENSSQ